MATETCVLMHTSHGDIKLKLYDKTPKHRDNFLELVRKGQYNGLLFHRVIQDFMIQGGDVTSKDAPLSKSLGAGDLGYTIPAEFNYPEYFHKKGHFVPHVRETKSTRCEPHRLPNSILLQVKSIQKVSSSRWKNSWRIA